MNYKKTNLIFIIAFLALLIVPILCTNYEKGAISEIDNRKLAKNPIWMFIGEKAPLGESVENYLNDRLGFRKELINFYQTLFFQSTCMLHVYYPTEDMPILHHAKCLLTRKLLLSLLMFAYFLFYFRLVEYIHNL